MNKNIYWSYILMSYISLLAMGFIDNIRGPLLLEFTEDLNFTDTQASFLFVIPSFFAFLGCQLSNILLYKIHSLNGLAYSLLCMGFGFLALSKVSGIMSLILSGGCFGIGIGMLGIFQNMNIHLGASEGSRRRLLSGLHAMYALSALCAPLFVREVFALDWSWRKGFFVASFFPLAMGFLFLLFLVFKRKKGDAVMILSLSNNNRSKGDILHYIYVGAILSFYLACETAISTRLTLYVRRYAGSSAEFSTYYLILFFVLLFLGRTLFLFIDSKQWKNETIWFYGISLSALSMLCGLWISPWFLSLCGLTMAPCFAVGMDYVFDIFREKSSEALSYVMGLFSFFVVPIHYLIGYLSDIFGLRVALMVGPFVLILSLLMMRFRVYFLGSSSNKVEGITH